MLTDLANREPEEKEADPSGMPAGDYMSFWESFGKMIKLGCIEDQDNKYAPHATALCNISVRLAGTLVELPYALAQSCLTLSCALSIFQTCLPMRSCHSRAAVPLSGCRSAPPQC